MGSLILPSRNRLIRPAGMPRPNMADPLIAAMGTLGFLGVSAGANFKDLVTGKLGSASSASAKADSVVGLSTVIGLGGSVTFAGRSTAAISAVTFAAIGRSPSSWTAGFNVIFGSSSATAAGFIGGFATASGSNQCFVQNTANGGTSTSPYVMPVNTPFFVMAGLTAGFTVNAGWAFVVRLDTGMFTGGLLSTGSTGASSPSNGTCIIGNDYSFADGFVGGISALMFSPKFIPYASAVAAYARNPWSLWYPEVADLSLLIGNPVQPLPPPPSNIWPQWGPLLAS